MSDLKVATSCPYPSHPPPIELRLAVLPEHPCSYFPDRVAQSRAFLASGIDTEIYHDFMDANFRRSGQLIYQPICSGCRLCKQIRVLTKEFRANKSQRRSLARNADLVHKVGEPEPSEEKFDLYSRYQSGWHSKSGDETDYDSFVSFLYESPVQTIEYCYRDQSGKLLAVGICDVSDRSLSSVYFYHDPEHCKRGLGVYGAMVEISHAAEMGIPYYYLGYWIDGCPTMDYKIQYQPSEILEPDGQWVRRSTTSRSQLG